MPAMAKIASNPGGVGVATGVTSGVGVGLTAGECLGAGVTGEGEGTGIVHQTCP